jgi:hypothetical protein
MHTLPCCIINHMKEIAKDLSDVRRGFWWTFIVVAFIVFLLVAAYGVVVAFLLPNPLEKAGQFGDSFAPLNTLFAGLAFSAVWASLRMQRHQLELQNEALRLTQQDLRQSVEAQQRAADAADRDQVSRNRPRIVALLEFGSYAAYFVLRNDGLSPARCLGLTVDRDVKIYSPDSQSVDANLSSLALFTTQTHTLAPNATVSYLLKDSNPSSFAGLAFSVTAQYADVNGMVFTEKFDLDLTILLGSTPRSDSSLSLIAKNLERIETALNRIQKKNSKVAVVSD